MELSVHIGQRARRISGYLLGSTACAALLASNAALADSIYPKPAFPVENGPIASARADFDGDGALDLVVANVGSGSVSVLLGGSYPFAESRNYAVSAQSDSNPLDVTVADFNGDGAPDIATTNSNNTISILINDGDGGFDDAKMTSTGALAGAIAAADVDNDDAIDLVVTNNNNDNISVFSGHGDGTFAAPVAYPTGATPIAVALADLDGDGATDVITADSGGNSISVLPGDGSGAFNSHNEFDAGVKPTALALGDVTGDGAVDVVLATLNDNQISVVSGNGDGSFNAPQSVKIGLASAGVAVGDLNDDGVDDVVAADTQTSDGKQRGKAISVLIGTGDGGFEDRSDIATQSVSPHAVAIGDFDNDGKADVTVSGAYNGNVSLISGQGDGTFQSGYTLSTPDAPAAVAVADVNGDGTADVISANSGNDDNVSVFLGGNNDKRTEYAMGDRPNDLVVRDINGDGRPDIVTADTDSNVISVRLNIGDGKFGDRKSYDTGKSPIAVDVADLNGDGLLDAVVANDAPKEDAGSISVFSGNGDGTFADGKQFPAGKSPQSVKAGDLNGDGSPDVVVANFTNQISVLINDGDGAFAAPTTYAVDGKSQPYAASIADLDNDGHADIVVSATRASKVGVFLGDGSGEFGDPEFYRTGSQPYGLAIADVNGDGNPDVITANNGSGGASLLVGRGDGSFETHRDYPARDFPLGVTAADINDDGQFDLLVANGGADSITVLPEAAGKAGNTPPEVQDLSETVKSGDSVDDQFKGSDREKDDLTYEVATPPAHGDVSVDGDTFTYTPDANYTGNDSFTYTANDGSLTSTPGTVSITVEAGDGGTSPGGGSGGSGNGGGGGGGAGSPLGLALLGLLAFVSRRRLTGGRA